MSAARLLVGDVFDRLAELPDGSVDVIVTSPPFLALRSYLPADHPDKGKEIGSEATPAEFLDVMFRLSAEWRRVLAPHGSLCVELGDTYSGSGGAGGDYTDTGLRAGQAKFDGSGRLRMRSGAYDAPQDADGGYAADQRVRREGFRSGIRNMNNKIQGGGDGWPDAKSRTLIPELYRVGLAYGLNPLTGDQSPAGRWRVRNVVTWCRPNPPVGALGDKWRPATSDIVIACTSPKRYWDDLATRRPAQPQTPRHTNGPKSSNADRSEVMVGFDVRTDSNPAGAPLLDWWEIPPGGYSGAHYAVYPPALVEPLVKAMCPEKVCTECGEPSRRIVADEYTQLQATNNVTDRGLTPGVLGSGSDGTFKHGRASKTSTTLGWSDCGHDDSWRPGVVLDPFAGSGTTLAVATGYGRDAIGIDLDERNADLALERVGMFLTVEDRQVAS